MSSAPITRRGFPIPEDDIARAKIAARAAGQSLNAWVARAIRAALDAPVPGVSPEDLRAHEQRLGALIGRMEHAVSAPAVGGPPTAPAPFGGLDDLMLGDAS